MAQIVFLSFQNSSVAQKPSNHLFLQGKSYMDHYYEFVHGANFDTFSEFFKKPLDLKCYKLL